MVGRDLEGREGVKEAMEERKEGDGRNVEEEEDREEEEEEVGGRNEEEGREDEEDEVGGRDDEEDEEEVEGLQTRDTRETRPSGGFCDV